MAISSLQPSLSHHSAAHAVLAYESAPNGQAPQTSVGQGVTAAAPISPAVSAAPTAFSITSPPTPATNGDVVVFEGVEHALTAKTPKAQVDGLFKAAILAEKQLPPQLRQLYTRTLVVALQTNKEPNIDALNATLVNQNGGKPPAGPFTMWYLDAFLHLMSRASQQSVASKNAATTGNVAAAQLSTESPMAAPAVVSSAALNSQAQAQQQNRQA